MDAPEQPRSIQVNPGPDGSLTYLIDVPPEDLPPVRGRDLERAWLAARDAAIAHRWGAVRGFRFVRRDGTHLDLALSDRDARCWAAAVDSTLGLHTNIGLSLCLRLLALVELLAQAPWARPWFQLARDGAELHPVLWRTAASVALSADARFDESTFRPRMERHVAGLRLASPSPAPSLAANSQAAPSIGAPV